VSCFSFCCGMFGGAMLAMVLLETLGASPINVVTGGCAWCALWWGIVAAMPRPGGAE